MNFLNKTDMRCEPFSMSPDPRFLYRSREHEFVLNRLEIAIRLRRGLNVCLADIGLGKTTLLRALAQNFALEEKRFKFYLILDPSFRTEKEFLDHLVDLFGLGIPHETSARKREAVQRHLYQENIDAGRTVVLCIDEAQKLSSETLECLRVFLNYENLDHKFLQLVMFGQMELLPLIRSMPNFADRISFKYILHPLDFHEMSAMIRYRLQEAGYDSKDPIFTDEALYRIHQCARGYPRKVIRICQRAFEPVLTGEATQVTVDAIDRFADEERDWGIAA